MRSAICSGVPIRLLRQPPSVSRAMMKALTPIFSRWSFARAFSSAYPPHEEAYRTAEALFPLLPVARYKSAASHSLTGPFGELVANEIPPGPARQRAQS